MTTVKAGATKAEMVQHIRTHRLRAMLDGNSDVSGECTGFISDISKMDDSTTFTIEVTRPGQCSVCGERLETEHELAPTHDYPKPCRSVCVGSGKSLV